MCIRLDSPEAVAVVSSYFLPITCVCKDAVAFLEHPGAIFKFLQDDLNVAPGNAREGGAGSRLQRPKGLGGP